MTFSSLYLCLGFALVGSVWLGALFRGRGDGALFLPRLFSHLVAITYVCLAMFLSASYEEAPFGVWSLYTFGAVMVGFLLPNFAPHVWFWIRYRFFAGIQTALYTMFGKPKT